MADLLPSLRSLFDSLRALPSRMAETDQNRVWVTSLMILIGELQQDPENLEGTDEDEAATHQFAAEVSMLDSSDGAAIEALLQAVEDYLRALFKV